MGVFNKKGEGHYIAGKDFFFRKGIFADDHLWFACTAGTIQFGKIDANRFLRVILVPEAVLIFCFEGEGTKVGAFSGVKSQ